LAILSGYPLARGQDSPARKRIHLLVPGCGAALPLDAGQAFAGPRFLIWDDRLAFFEEVPSARTGQPERPWRMTASERLSAAPPAAGLGRARVKWRDGALWMKAGSRIYQRDAGSLQWFLAADPGLDFRDFDLDLKGRILLVATADPRTHKYRALLEAVGPDRRSSEILWEYPDRDHQRWFDQGSPVAAATLLTGYESVQIQEFIVLCNPLARRVFIYHAMDGTLREAALGLPTRGIRALAARGSDEPAAPDDLCWQVLPKGPSEAWIVVHAGIGAGPVAEDGAASGNGLEAIALDLVEGRADGPIPLKGLRLPLFFDPQGRLTGMADALGKLGPDAGSPEAKGNKAVAPDPAFSVPAVQGPGAARRESPPG
jgi:hypothetical protein